MRTLLPKIFSVAAATGMTLSLAAPALAATFQHNDAVSITSPLSGDVYAAGGTVDVRDAIDGDLFLAGGNVSVDGGVAQDLMAAGGNVNIRGDVGDDLRVAGGQITIRGNIGGDLIVMGGQVTVDPDTVVNGDVVIAGGMLTLEGSVHGKLRVAGGQLILRGIVDGDADIRSEDVLLEGTIGGNVTLAAQKLELAPGERINGTLSYWLPLQRSLDEAVRGQVSYDTDLRPGPRDDVRKGAAAAVAAGILGFQLFTLLSSALVILLLILLTRTYFADAARELRSRPGRSAWHGFLFLVLTPVAAVLAFITLVGFPIGMLLMVAYILTLVFSRIASSIVLAKWLELQWNTKWGNAMTFLWSMIAYVALKIISWIPFLGWMVHFAVILLCIGALMITKYRKWQQVR